MFESLLPDTVSAVDPQAEWKRQQERRRKAERAALDGVDGLLDPAQRETNGKIWAELPDGGAASKSRLANSVWLAGQLNRDAGEVSENYDYWRAIYARAEFDGEGMGDDAAFTARVKQAAQKGRSVRWLVDGAGQDEITDKAEREKVNTVAARVWAERAGLAGKPLADGYAAWQEAAKASPHWEAGKEADILPEFERAYNAATDAVAPYREKLDAAFQELAGAYRRGLGEDATGDTEKAISWLDSMSLDEFRRVGVPALQALAAEQPPEKRAGFMGWVANIADSGGDRLGAAAPALSDTAYLAGRAVMEPVARAVKNPEELADYEQRRTREKERAAIAAMIRTLGSSTIDPQQLLSSGTIGKAVEQASYDVAGSVGAMATMAVPILGIPASLATYAAENKADMLLSNPKISLDAASSAAMLAAPVQSALDFLSLKMVAGRLPGLSSIVQKLGAPGGNAAAKVAAYALGSAAVEYTAEQLQDAAPLAAQDVLAKVRSDVPAADWSGFESMNWRTLWAVLPLALVGAGANVARDTKAARALISDGSALEAVGFDFAQVAGIQAASDPVAEMRAQWGDRGAITEVAVKAFEGRQRLAQVEAETTVETMAGAGITIRREDGAFVVGNSATGAETRHASHESAMRMAAEFAGDQGMQRDAPFMAALGEFTRALPANRTLDISSDSSSLLDELIAATERKSAGTAQPDQDIRAIWDRAQVERGRLGETPLVEDLANPESAAVLGSFQVLGKSYTDLQGKVARSVSKVFAGSGVIDVLEEESENDIRELVASTPHITMPMVRSEIEKLEAATGDKYIHGTGETAVVEAWSDIVRLYATGTRKGNAVTKGIRQQVATEVRRAYRVLKRVEASGKNKDLFTILRQYMDLFKATMGRVARLMKAKADGNLEGLEDLIRQSVRLDEQDVHEKAVVQEAAKMFDSAPSFARQADVDPDVGFSLREDEIQGYFDFHGLPTEKQEDARKAIRRADRKGKRYKPIVSDAAGSDSHAALIAEREAAGRAFDSALSGDPSAFAGGNTVSRIFHKLVRQDIPAWDVRGARIEHSGDVAKLLMSIRSPYFESLKVAVLDENNTVIHSQILTVGSLSETVALPRDLLRVLSSANNEGKAASFIMSHNHPSGDPTPSQADVRMTKVWEQVGKSVGIEMLDHIVTNGTEYFSFSEYSKRDISDPVPAAWEATVSAKSMFTADIGRVLLKSLRTGDPDSHHIVYLDARMNVMAIERAVEVKIEDVAQAATMHGASGVVFGMPTGQTLDRGVYRRWKAFMDLAGLRLLDVMEPGMETWTERGLIYEDAAAYETKQPASDSISFSLSSVRTLEDVARQIEKMTAGSPAKLETFGDMARTLSGMARAAAGNEETEKILRFGEIETERKAMRQALVDEYATDVWKDNYAILGDNDLIGIRAQPTLAALLKSDKGKLAGRIISPAKAKRQGLWDPKREKGGDFDGMDGVPFWMFQGSDKAGMPDVLAAELGFESTDELWNAIHTELSQAGKNREWLRKAREALADAHQRAANEANAWAANERLKAQSSDKRDARRALVALDAMLLHLPAEVRGKVGGLSRMSELTTERQRAAHFRKTLLSVDRQMESYLRNQLVEKIRETITRGQAKKVAGEKDRGKLGINGHAWVDVADDAMRLTPLQLDQREKWITAAVGAPLEPAVIEELNRRWDLGTGEDAARLALEQEESILALFGGITHREGGRYVKGSEELQSALDALQDAVTTGRRAAMDAIIERREMRAGRRAGLKLDSANDGSAKAIQEREKEMQGLGGSVVKYFRKGFTFEQFIGDSFGRDSDTHRWAEGLVMNAEMVESAMFQDSQRGITDFLRSIIPGGTRKRLHAMEKLSTERPLPGAADGMPDMSELQAVHFTMLWADEDSREWLRTHGYGEDWQEAAEKFLSPAALSIREFLQARYDAQYDVLNTVFRRLHGANMPRVKNYAPRDVMHGQQAQTIDPLGQGGLSARGVFAGFTKRRRVEIKAAPEMRDALSAYMGNQRVVSHFVAWAEASSDLRAVFATSETAPFVKAAIGTKGQADLLQWLADLESGGVQEAQASEIWKRWMRANTDNALVGKLGVLAKQLPAAYAAAAEIGWSDYLRSARRVVSGKAAISRGETYETRIMRARGFQRPAEIGQAASGTGEHPWRARIRALGIDLTGLDLAKEWLRGRIGAVDAWFTAFGAQVAYDSHYQDALAQKMPETEAHEYAARMTEQTITRTAQPETLANKSLAENHQGTWGRMFHQFQSANRQALFMTVAGFRAGGIADGRAWRMAIMHWMLTGFVAQTMGNVVRDMFGDDEKDDEIWNTGDYVRAMLFGPITGAVQIGPIIGAAASLLGGFEQRFAPAPAAAVTSLGKEAIEAMKEDDFDLKDTETIVRALGLFIAGDASALNIGANVAKQVIGGVDNLATTPDEVTAMKAKQERKLDRMEKQEDADALTAEQRAAAKEKKEAAKKKRLKQDAAAYDKRASE